jgi:Spy/CpxP family protein refolding chaperone
MVTGKQIGAAALLLATFAAGGVIGRASARWTGTGSRQRSEGVERPRGSGGERRGGGFVAMLQRELTLTPAQKDSVQTILRHWDPAMRAVYDGMRPRFDSLRALVHADIMQVLTADQKAAFQRWSARTDSIAARKRLKEAQGVR